MHMLKRIFTTAIAVTVLTLGWGTSVWALPGLQLTFDPDKPLNIGNVIFYDNGEESTVMVGNMADGVTLTAYAVDSGDGHPFSVGNVTRTAFLVVSLPDDFVGDPNASLTVTVSANGTIATVPTWQFGIAPEFGGLPAEDLANHGIFPTWYTLVEFQFVEAVTEVPNVQDGEIKTFGLNPEEAWMAMIDVTITGGGVLGAHFDLITLEGDGSLGNAMQDFAPFSKDATVVPVPEPASAAMLVVGSAVLFRIRRRRAQATA